MSEEQTFKVGDTIRVFLNSQTDCYEALTKVAAICPSTSMLTTYFVAVDISGERRYFHPRQCELIERPKKMVKKKVWTYVANTKDELTSWNHVFPIQIEAEVPEDE